MQHFRGRPLTEEAFTDVWFDGLVQRVKAQDNAKSKAEVVAALGALHEYEYSKLKVALANEDYNALNHQNDLFDAEQLIYLGDPALHFVTLDGGYLPKIVKSLQRQRIHRIAASDLADAQKAEDLLAQITK